MSDYTVKKESDGFWQLWDGSNTAAYLIEGESRALLIDTMMSEEPLMPLIATLTSKPVDLALTHAHIDHMYRCGEFSKVYLHKSDIRHWRQGLGLLMALGTPLLKVKRKRYKVSSFTPLCGGSEINLGGVSVKCISVPGHTQGSVVFVDERHNAVICGDAVGSGSGVWLFLPMCETVGKYKSSLANAARELEKYRNFKFYGGHMGQDGDCGHPLSYGTFTDMEALCQKLLDGSAQTTTVNKIPGMSLIYAKEGAAAIVTRKGKLQE